MKNFPYAIVAFFFFQVVFSQTTGVSGTINDGEFNDVLPFANIVIKDTQTGTTSDFEGRYRLELEPGTYTLVFSFVKFFG